MGWPKMSSYSGWPFHILEVVQEGIGGDQDEGLEYRGARDNNELSVESMRKGRGAWIFETDRGLKLLKEYRGSVKRLEFEELVLGAVAGAGSLGWTSM